MHRIFLAYDGSRGSDDAVGLIASLRWPLGTRAALVTALPTTRELRRDLGDVILAAWDDPETHVLLEAHASLEGPCRTLSAAGMTVERRVVRGHPARALADAAAAFAATLVVVGSRGRGAVASTLLGSVSAELVDISPVPVLVARSPELQSVVLGMDGSPEALAAERFLGSLPLADGTPVGVVSVVEMVRPWAVGFAPTLYLDAVAAQAEYEAEARASSESLAEDAASRLADARFRTRIEVAVGDPARTILASADRDGADLVVVGSRGRTGVERLVLGSVARAVLHHAKASVLVVRTAAAPSSADRTSAEAARSADGERDRNVAPRRRDPVSAT